VSEESQTPFAEVIGDPIMQSKSPLIHGFWIKRLGLDATYGARRVAPDNLGDYLEQQRAKPNWRGCNVTMPLKQAILPLVDELEPAARAIGAVNTVYRGESGQLIGANTDGAGFCEPLREELGSKHLFRMARIIGTGGAARAIISALYEHSFTLVVAGRNEGKARELLNELAPQGEHYAAPLGHFAEPTNFQFDDREGCLDLVVNTSPLGMRGQPPLAFDMTHAPPGSIIYDIVTDPPDTDFLVRAQTAGHQTIGGFAMLIGQAAVAFEKFFGEAAPRDHDSELKKMLTP